MTDTAADAYRVAENKIAAAFREQSVALDLSAGTIGRLTRLPESLVQLTQLQGLELRNHQLSAFPEWLGQLRELKVLDLRGNKVSRLPESFRQLSHLQHLYLTANQLRALPEWLGQLTQLQRLYLANNQLSTLPERLGQLTQLQELDLGGNRLHALPEWLGQLTQLQGLYISGNQLSTLPEWLGQLRQLQGLYISRNQLRALPDELGQLRQLQALHLDSNELKTLPASLRQLRSLQRLYLHENPALGLPLEILGPTWLEIGEPADPHAILAFYFGQQKQTAKPLNEVKLLLVGHGRVGKTSLSKALRSVAHDLREPETPGIERHPLPLTAGRSRITAHIWDFGGQEFLHQTHQFFFSQRSIYLVVLTGRQGRPMQEAEYWLRLIRTYGTGSPVVIALNQIRAHPFNVDEHFLQENYPEVKAVIKTDCDPRVGIESLKKVLGKLATDMPSVQQKIEPSWARVRARLENMKESFVTFDEYREICAEEGVNTAETQDTLATILDYLGVALNYRNDPRLHDTSVLKPRWLVDGIYTILRWLHKHETNGELRLEDFPKALKSKKAYPPDMHKFLLALMEKFELCFRQSGAQGGYLVPALLDANQPRELKKFMDGNARRIQFRYEDVRPPGLLPRFIVRSHSLSERQARWVRGVVLARGSARALIRGDHEGRVTDVFAIGDDVADRIWLTEFILSEMRILHDKLPVRTFVESEAQTGVWTELEILREEALKPGGIRTERATDGSTVMVNAKQTLREVETAQVIIPTDKPLSIFICYAHANERVVRQFIPSLKVLARRGYIMPWRDTDLVSGEDWDETIKQRMSEAQIILFMVSREFLASRYITEEERPLAMSLMKDKKAIVVPVLLSACMWFQEDFAVLEMLPRKQEPVSSFNPRADAWFLIEEGLKKVVERARPMLTSPTPTTDPRTRPA